MNLEDVQATWLRFMLFVVSAGKFGSRKQFDKDTNDLVIAVREYGDGMRDMMSILQGDKDDTQGSTTERHGSQADGQAE